MSQDEDEDIADDTINGDDSSGSDQDDDDDHDVSLGFKVTKYRRYRLIFVITVSSKNEGYCTFYFTIIC